MAAAQRHHKPVPLASERVALEALVQRIHENDEQQRGERVTLAQAATDRERPRESKRCADARRESCQAVLNQRDKGSRHAQSVHRAHQDSCLHGVVGLFDVVEECVQLVLASLAPVPCVE